MYFELMRLENYKIKIKIFKPETNVIYLKTKRIA